MKQAYHSIFLQDANVRVIGEQHQSLLSPTLCFPPGASSTSLQPQYFNLLTCPHAHRIRKLRPSPPPHQNPRSRLRPPHHSTWTIGPGNRPRQRVLRPTRRSPLPLPRQHLLPKLRDQRSCRSSLDLWHSLRERGVGKSEARFGEKGCRKGAPESGVG